MTDMLCDAWVLPIAYLRYVVGRAWIVRGVYVHVGLIVLQHAAGNLSNIHRIASNGLPAYSITSRHCNPKSPPVGMWHTSRGRRRAYVARRQLGDSQ